MEYADKGTMNEYIGEAVNMQTEYVFHEIVVWTVLHQLSSALSFLNNLQPKAVLHRDLKPKNVLGVTDPRDGKVLWKLADFGLSRLLTTDHASSEVGTQVYMAPEVLQ